MTVPGPPRWTMATLSLLAIPVLVFAAACGSAAIAEVNVGDCFAFVDEPTVSSVTLQDCASAHGAEAFALIDADDAIRSDGSVEARCFVELAALFDTSDLSESDLPVDAATSSFLLDRSTAICVLESPSEQLTQSVVAG